ncbi:SAM-dependent methyltransferase [Sneathiella sp.]|jgi:predicted RNA methylase|uniref:SAM-dependent methyltransferase n=1 Tax=Sneathiella sp. TaxID=1964365 RepID=UPI0039E41F2B
MNMQNTSHAVMSQRYEGKESADNFPTPPWATRALIKYVIRNEVHSSQTCLEPACGQGHMAKPLEEYFQSVVASDIINYGYGSTADFLGNREKDVDSPASYDWVITNPPFRLAEEFVHRALEVCNIGVAILARTVFLESVGRYERLFNVHKPAKFAQFVERVPMVKGRLDQKASTATGYAWIVWKKDSADICETVWIPPCRKELELNSDYAYPIAPKKIQKDDGSTLSLFEPEFQFDV